VTAGGNSIGVPTRVGMIAVLDVARGGAGAGTGAKNGFVPHVGMAGAGAGTAGAGVSVDAAAGTGAGAGMAGAGAGARTAGAGAGAGGVSIGGGDAASARPSNAFLGRFAAARPRFFFLRRGGAEGCADLIF